MTIVTERARCPEHGLILGADGACIRCTRTRERETTRRALAICAVAFAAIVLILSLSRVVALVAPAMRTSAPAAEANASAVGQGTLVVYTTASCPHCRRAKAWLDERRVAYVERRIDEDPAAQRELAARSGRVVVPTFVIDDDVQPGMDAQGILLERLLAKHGLR